MEPSDDMEIEPYVREDAEEQDDDEEQGHQQQDESKPIEVILRTHRISDFHLPALLKQLLYMHGVIPMPYDAMLRECDTPRDHAVLAAKKPLERTRIKRWQRAMIPIRKAVDAVSNLFGSEQGQSVQEVIFCVGASIKIPKIMYCIKLHRARAAEQAHPLAGAVPATPVRDSTIRAFQREIVMNLASDPMTTKVLAAGKVFILLRATSPDHRDSDQPPPQHSQLPADFVPKPSLQLEHPRRKSTHVIPIRLEEEDAEAQDAAGPHAAAAAYTTSPLMIYQCVHRVAKIR